MPPTADDLKYPIGPFAPPDTLTPEQVAARSVTDFHYCCYLSDLAVDGRHQRQGIGTRLIRETQDRLRPTCRLTLLSAPAAVDYYPKVGFEHHPQAWTVPPGRLVGRS